MLGDRYPRERVLLVHEPHPGRARRLRPPLRVRGRVDWSVYALAIAATIATTPFRLGPSGPHADARPNPAELTAANAVASGVESLAFFAGPALAGLLLAFGEHGVVFAITAALSCCRRSSSSCMPSRARAERPQTARSKRRPSSHEALAGSDASATPSLRVMVLPLDRTDRGGRRRQVFIVVACDRPARPRRRGRRLPELRDRRRRVRRRDRPRCRSRAQATQPCLHGRPRTRGLPLVVARPLAGGRARIAAVRGHRLRKLVRGRRRV